MEILHKSSPFFQCGFQISKESTIDWAYSSKIFPDPSFSKRGNSSLGEREGRRDLFFGVYTMMD
jgi:hypothetical protein